MGKTEGELVSSLTGPWIPSLPMLLLVPRHRSAKGDIINTLAISG